MRVRTELIEDKSWEITGLVITKMIKKDKVVWALFWAGISEGYFSWVLVIPVLGAYMELERGKIGQ